MQEDIDDGAQHLCIFDKKSLKQVFSDAKGGSIADLDELANHMDEIPLSMRGTVVEILITFLSRPVLTNGDEKRVPTDESIMLSFVSMMCLASIDTGNLIAENAEARGRNSGSLRAMVTRGWPRIRDWLYYVTVEIENVVRVLGDGCAPYQQRTQTVCVMVCAFLFRLRQDKVLDEMIRRDELVVEVVQNLWIEQGTNDTPLPKRYRRGYRPAIVSLQYSELCKGKDGRRRRDKITKASHQSIRYAIAETALAHIRFTSKRLNTVSGPAEMNTHSLNAVRAVTGGEDASMKAFCDRSGISIVTKALRRVLARVISQPDEWSTSKEDPTLSTLMYLTNLLALLLHTERADLKVREALRYGLLPILGTYTTNIISAKQSAKDQKNHNIFDAAMTGSEQLLRCIIRLTPLRTVVGKVAKSVAEMEGSGELDRLIAIGGDIGDDWAMLRQLVLERSICKSILDNALYSQDRVCEGCGAYVANYAIKRCAGCQSAIYCTKECQKTMWGLPERDHRSECKQRAAQRRYMDSRSGRNDMKFLVKVAASVIRRHLSSIRVLISRTYPNVALSDVGIHVDYLHNSFIPVIGLFRTRHDPEAWKNFKLLKDSAERRDVEPPFTIGRLRYWDGTEQVAWFPIEKSKLWTLPHTRPGITNSVIATSEAKSSSYYKRVGAQTLNLNVLTSERDEIDECLDLVGRLVEEKPELSYQGRIDKAVSMLYDRWIEEDADLYSKWE